VRRALPGRPGWGLPRYQPTLIGPDGASMAPSGVRPTGSTGASTPIRGMSNRAGGAVTSGTVRGVGVGGIGDGVGSRRGKVSATRGVLVDSGATDGGDGGGSAL